MNWMTRSRSKKRASPFILGCEPLERREFLRGGGIAWAELPQLDLSFAPDGVDIAGEPNTLSSNFDDRFGAGQWQQTILRAFQTWAVHTNANIGVVEEVGMHAFGTAGRRVGDERFGDIRIGARPLNDGALAVAVAHDTFIAGTWSGDVILNTDEDFHSLDGLFSVVLHEAGHVFGLDHSDNPDSPMHVHGISAATTLLEEDVDNLTSLYGDRERDEFEGRIGNDRVITATAIRNNSTPGERIGSAPVVMFADISTNDDVDYFWLRAPADYDGSITLQIRAAGLSLLAPSLKVANSRGRLLHESAAESIGDGLIEVDISDWEGILLLKVNSEHKDAFGIGAYSLTVTYNGVNEVDESTIDDLSGSRYAGLDIDDIFSFFQSGDRRRFRDDKHGDDNADSARTIPHTRQSEELLSMKAVGSLSDASDVDFYRLESPERHFARESTGYISVRSLEAGTLIPEISLFQGRDVPVKYDVLVNGNGELLVQVTDIRAGTPLQLAVNGGGDVPNFQQGNYELNVFFTKDAIVLETFAEGQVNSEIVGTHRLHVASPQLFHFALTVDGDDSRSGLLANLIDENHEVVHRIVTPRGDTRTNGSAFLLPGTYTLQLVPLSLDVTTSDDPVGFSLTGAGISDPFGIDPVLPDDTEYACPDVSDEYCFPDGTQTTSPFDWEAFAESFEDLFLESTEVGDLIVAEWWSSFWDSDQETEPPVTTPESYDVDVDGVLQVSTDDGVLANDVSEKTTIASVTRLPSNGQLELSLEGDFVYTPDPGFVGIDYFEYVASDFHNWSEPATVKIAVGVGILDGDFDGNGHIDTIDVDVLSAAIQTAEDMRFDLNSDGAVDVEDHRFLIYNILGTTFGDSNLDGKFDSTDLVLVFQAGNFERVTTSGWQQGDWNADGIFDSADLVAAFQADGYSASSMESSRLPLIDVWAIAEDQRIRFDSAPHN